MVYRPFQWEAAVESDIATAHARGVSVPSGHVELQGILEVPDAALGFVLFAHGAGSSRLSPRNRQVAGALRRAGFGSLLFDLLTGEEEAEARGHVVRNVPTQRVGASKGARRAPLRGELRRNPRGPNVATLRAAPWLEAFQLFRPSRRASRAGSDATAAAACHGRTRATPTASGSPRSCCSRRRSPRRCRISSASSLAFRRSARSRPPTKARFSRFGAAWATTRARATCIAPRAW